MSTYIVRRLLALFPVFAGVLVITFTLGYFGPGDPLRFQHGEQLPPNPEQLAMLRAYYGLDQPFHVQFGRYVWKLLHGDMGVSLSGSQRSVSESVLAGLGVSAQLGVAAAAIILALGIPLGTWAALKQNTRTDHLIVGLASVLPTIPTFVLCPLALIIFVLQLKLIPYTHGWKGIFDSRAILPVAILCIGPLLGVVRNMRSSVLEVLGQEYIRTARAKGLPNSRVLYKHVIRNALTPVVTNTGFMIAGLLTGAFFVEQAFGVPGYGSAYIAALVRNDYPVILGITIIISLFVVTSNFTVDILYGIIDPRVRIDS